MSIIKLNNRSVKDITQFGSISSLGSLTHIATQTASSSASLSFTSGIDSTYKEYIFYFVNIHPSAQADFTFNLSTDGGSNYNVTKTTTDFRVFQTENGSSTSLSYEGGLDLAQSTGEQIIAQSIDDANDACSSGFVNLFNPSSTTFVKHFIGISSLIYADTYCMQERFAGYGNTTSAINAVRFKMSSGNIDSGQILLFGLN